MAAMSFDNVIRFPDGARSPGLGPDRVRSLKDARDLLVQKFRDALHALLTGLDEELCAKADRAESGELRTHYYRTRDALRDHGARLEALLGVNWLRLFDDAVRGKEISTLTKKAPSSLDELQLVDYGDVDAELATKSIAGRFRDGCEEGLFAAGRRLAYLAGREDDSLPLEDTLSGALRAALDEVGFAAPVRLEVLQGIESRVVAIFSPVVEELNDFLLGRNILPKLRRSFARPSAGKSAAEPEPAREAAAGAGDVFSVLQRLVAGGAPAAAAAPTAAAPAGMPGTPGDAIPSVAMMTQVMERAMASLDVLQRSVPVVIEATPSTNVLREFRASVPGQELGYLDAVTVDIVATLFDFIFDDKGIADPIKALIGRLQIPVLKVAMLDKSFFSSKAHPARRLLDGISRAAVRCGPAAGHEDPLYARIQAIIDRLQSEFAQDTRLFEELCLELESFLDSQEEAADALAARAAPLVAVQEQKELAALAAEQALAGWLSSSLPVAVSDLLDHEWRALLVKYYVDNDDEAWGQAASTVADLVASVQPQPDVKDRKVLATRLPTLVKRIHDGLNHLDIPDNRRLAVIDSLFSLHAAVLRGAAPVVSDVVPVAATEPAAEAEIASEHVESGDAQLDHLSLADTFVPATGDGGDTHSQVAHLQRGDWVEFLGGDTGPTRYRLAWVSPQRGILLFTNPDSPRALSVAPAALSLQIERGEAIIVSAEPIFDRAVSRALESLQAA